MKYEVYVSNFGIVHEGINAGVAERIFNNYKESSQSNVGEAANQEVLLYLDGKIIKSYYPEPQNEFVEIGKLDAGDCFILEKYDSKPLMVIQHSALELAIPKCDILAVDLVGAELNLFSKTTKVYRVNR